MNLNIVIVIIGTIFSIVSLLSNRNPSVRNFKKYVFFIGGLLLIILALKDMQK